MTRHPDKLSHTDRVELGRVLARSALLTSTYQHVREFADIMVTRTGDKRLMTWLSEIDHHGAPALRSFARGIRSDLAAVTAGLTLHHSSDAVEGTVTKIKAVKRSMYGRANLDLLRARVLHMP
ncbi:transposase [Nocardia abscessus]|uniref:transposase n=1 Tax=Nocardia abscessus TaxID=120957 RepID=UPI00245903B3|nr:transposase [Nocardia abscessus]